MTASWLEIPGCLGPDRPTTRRVLAAYCAVRWPTSRRKSVEREWDLTADKAKAVCEGTASAATIDEIWSHPRGGWDVLLPIMAAVIGRSVEGFVEQERKRSDDRTRRLGALGAALSSLPAPVPAGGAGVGREPHRRGPAAGGGVGRKGRPAPA